MDAQLTSFAVIDKFGLFIFLVRLGMFRKRAIAEQEESYSIKITLTKIQNGKVGKEFKLYE